MQRIRPWVAGIAIMAMLAPVAAQAQFTEKIRTGVQQAGGASGIDQTESLETIIGNIIRSLLTFVGVILLLVLLYAGFLWMTAGGDSDKVKKARGMILNAVIGLVIIILSYAITDFVLARLIEATAGGSGAGGTTPVQ